MVRSLRRYTYEVLEAGGPRDRIDRLVDGGLFLLIVANILALMLATVPSIDARFHDEFIAFELVSVVVFSVEYVARLWVCTADPRFRHPVLGRLRYAATPLALVDLLAILPFYVPFIVAVDLRFLRVLRLMRIARILKVARYSEGFRTLGLVFRGRAPELAASMFIVLVLAVLASSLMYYVENTAQPEKFSSIPETMWWAVVTLTTVGYGDTFPITPLGRFLGAFVALLGVAMVALPAGILGSGFIDELGRKREARASPARCPHCGEDLHAEPDIVASE